MFKSLRLKVLAGLLALAVTIPAASQLIYGNTFPFWTVNGPLTVVGNTSLTGGTNTLGGTTSITGTTTIGAGATLTNPTLVGATISGTSTQATIAASVSVTAPILTTSGFIQFPAPRTVTNDATVAATDSWIIVNKAGSVTLTLPDPTTAGNTGRLVCVKTSQAQTVVSASSNVIPLITASAGTAILAGTAGKWACMLSDATNWVIMAAN